MKKYLFWYGLLLWIFSAYMMMITFTEPRWIVFTIMAWVGMGMMFLFRPRGK